MVNHGLKCPYCKTVLKISPYASPKTVESDAKTHLYKKHDPPGEPEWVNPRLHAENPKRYRKACERYDVAKERYNRSPRLTRFREVMGTWPKQCVDMLYTIRREHHKSMLLSPRELRRRQVLAGKNQAIEAKRKGGLNQSLEAKRKGGLASAAKRWGFSVTGGM
jgi:hypothetical protein